MAGLEAQFAEVWRTSKQVRISILIGFCITGTFTAYTTWSGDLYHPFLGYHGWRIWRASCVFILAASNE